jgi:hypothetical protein
LATRPGPACALSQLYRRTGNTAYLTAALNVGNWIVTNTYNTLGPGGYSFGTNINQFNQSVRSPNGKSTEHNIDTYAFFTMLDRLSDHGFANNGMSWSDLAARALNFVIAMYSATGGYFYKTRSAIRSPSIPTPFLKIVRSGPISPFSTTSTARLSTGPSPISKPPTLPHPARAASPAPNPSPAWFSIPPVSALRPTIRMPFGSRAPLTPSLLW